MVVWFASLCVSAAVAAPGVVLAASSTESPPLLEYGAVGAMAVLALGAVKVLWAASNRATSEATEALQKALDIERARADRLEEELRKSNILIQERIVTALQDSTRAVTEAYRENR